MAIETMGEAVEMYVEALGLRFAVSLIEFFGAGLGVDEDYLPAATRDRMDPAALRLDVVDGTQVATAGSEDDEMRLEGDDLRQAQVRLALARRDEPVGPPASAAAATHAGHVDPDDQATVAADSSATAAATAEWLGRPGVDGDITASGERFVLTDDLTPPAGEAGDTAAAAARGAQE